MPNLEFSSSSYALLKFQHNVTHTPLCKLYVLPKPSAAKDTKIPNKMKLVWTQKNSKKIQSLTILTRMAE